MPIELQEVRTNGKNIADDENTRCGKYKKIPKKSTLL